MAVNWRSVPLAMVGSAGETSIESSTAPVTLRPVEPVFPPKTAERLVVLGFFDEVLGQLPVGALATELRAQVAGKLDRRSE